MNEIAKLLLFMLFNFCIFVAPVHAESAIRLWKNQTVYVPINSQLFVAGDEKRPIKLSTNLIIRNTDSLTPIKITEINYYNSEGKLITTYLDSSKSINPRASTYILIERRDERADWGAHFIIKWESVKSVTQPLVEVIHAALSGTHGGLFKSRGVPIRGVYE